jgi:hypothetical protein
MKQNMTEEQFARDEICRIGKSLFDCHQQSSNEKIVEIMQTGKPQIYTTEKQGKKRLFYQSRRV